jgi:hypothetical protein
MLVPAPLQQFGRMAFFSALCSNLLSYLDTGMKGLEPLILGSKFRCLATWPHPIPICEAKVGFEPTTCGIGKAGEETHPLPSKPYRRLSPRTAFLKVRSGRLWPSPSPPTAPSWVRQCYTCPVALLLISQNGARLFYWPKIAGMLLPFILAPFFRTSVIQGGELYSYHRRSAHKRRDLKRQMATRCTCSNKNHNTGLGCDCPCEGGLNFWACP